MFERLTVRCIDEPVYIPDESKWQVEDELGAKCLVGEAVDRLAAYEDSGLSAEEVKALRQENEQCKAGKGKIGKWPVEIGTLFMGLKIVGADYRCRTIEIEWKEKEGE